MRRLILLRHAKSAWPDGVWDHERPLAPRGEEAMTLVGPALVQAGASPNRILVSTAKRTRETFDLLPAAFKEPTTEVVSEPRIYESSASTLRDVVSETPERCETLLLIGHNPGIAELCFLLVRPVASSKPDLDRLAAKFPTAAFAVLEFDREDWEISPRSARLARFVTPRQLGGIDED